LANEHQGDNEGVVHYEGGIPVFNTRLNNLENEAREAKTRDEQYKQKQLDLNQRLVWFTGVLAFVGILGGAISAYQTHISGVNAAAAQANAEAAKNMVEEMKKSGNDTHELAVQAKNQTERTKDLVEKASAQSEATNRLAIQAQRQANIAHNAMTASSESAEKDRRPWVGIQVDCSTCQKFEANGSLNVSIVGVIANSGKTPAIGMKFSTSISGPSKDSAIPSIDSIEQEADARLRENMSHMRPEVAAEVAKAVQETAQTQPIIALAPNAARNFGFGPITYTGRQFQPGQLARNQQQSIYAVGKVSYYGTDRKREYVTTFCLVNEYGHREFTFCSTGNDMK